MLTGQSSWVMGIVGNAAFQLILLLLFPPAAAGGPWRPSGTRRSTPSAAPSSSPWSPGPTRCDYGLLLAAAYALLAIVALVLGRRHIRDRRPETADEASDELRPATHS